MSGWGDDDEDDGGWGDDADGGGGDEDGWGDADGGDGGGDGGWDDVGGGDDEEPGELDWTIQVENLFYMAEGERKEDPADSLEKFQQCVKLEEEKDPDGCDKRFPSLKYITIILFQMGKTQEMAGEYKKLLSYASKVSPNDLNNAIRAILNTVEDSSNKKALADMYEITLDYFQKSGKELFWFDYAMRLCKTYFSAGNLPKCSELLDKLHASCRLDSGEDDPTKGAQLLEIYAIRMQVVGVTNDRGALNELFQRTSALSADINEPKTMSIIKECWGKMYASLNNWQEAYNNFFEAFRMYQEVGHANVTTCLKYVVLASMLTKDRTNPFATQEARVYQQHEKIIPISTILDAFEDDDIRKFEDTLAKNKENLLEDPTLVEHMPALKLKLRSRVIVKLIKPYTRVRLKWLCRQLNATNDEIENLVVNLILDGSINGRVDQINGLLDLTFLPAVDPIYAALEGWAKSVARLQQTVTNRSGRSEGRGGPMMGGYMDFDDDPFIGFDDGYGFM